MYTVHNRTFSSLLHFSVPIRKLKKFYGCFFILNILMEILSIFLCNISIVSYIAWTALLQQRERYYLYDF